MSRAALIKTNIIIGVAVLLGLGGGVWAYTANSPTHKVEVRRNEQQQITQISYYGQQGQNALALLKKHASVQTHHYSFGDMVVSINGVKGTGPKYWTFYVNGKEASVGAGNYATKNSDLLKWELR